MLQDDIQERPIPTKTDGVSGLLSRYQTLLLDVINEPDVPGVSSRDLEAFRNEFCTSAHTCRLRSCPRATVGFETKALRIEHEVSHVRRYPCTHTGCRYPPFLTQRSLKDHVRKEHDIAKTPRPLRRTKKTVSIGERRQASNTLGIPPIPANRPSAPGQPPFNPQNHQTQQRTLVKQEDTSAIMSGKKHPGVPPGHHMAPGMAHNPKQPGPQPGISHLLAPQMAAPGARSQINQALDEPSMSAENRSQDQTKKCSYQPRPAPWCNLRAVEMNWVGLT